MVNVAKTNITIDIQGVEAFKQLEERVSKLEGALKKCDEKTSGTSVDELIGILESVAMQQRARRAASGSDDVVSAEKA